MKGMVRWSIEDTVARYITENGAPNYWKRPLVGFADAGSPLFPELKKVCCKEHKVPQDYLPGARTVISYFLPFKEYVSESNIDCDGPSETWVDAYNTTNRLAVSVNRDLVSMLQGMGSEAAVPEDAGILINQTYSAWSQRHVARIAGLGTFGMNNMLITESGCCGRFFSVITDMELDNDRPLESERCIHKATGGCGVCMERCVAGALGENGFVRSDCYDVCMENMREKGADVCGKCVVGLPCTHRTP